MVGNRQTGRSLWDIRRASWCSRLAPRRYAACDQLPVLHAMACRDPRTPLLMHGSGVPRRPPGPTHTTLRYFRMAGRMRDRFVSPSTQRPQPNLGTTRRRGQVKKQPVCRHHRRPCSEQMAHRHAMGEGRRRRASPWASRPRRLPRTPSAQSPTSTGRNHNRNQGLIAGRFVEPHRAHAYAVGTAVRPAMVCPISGCVRSPGTRSQALAADWRPRSANGCGRHIAPLVGHRSVHS